MNRLKSAIRASAKGPVTRTGSNSYRRTYCFEPDFVGFSGHFPGYPILPAVVQVFTVLSMAEEVRGYPLRLRSIGKAKFHMEIYPGHDVRVEYWEGLVKGEECMECALTIGERIASTFNVIIAGKEEERR